MKGTHQRTQTGGQETRAASGQVPRTLPVRVLARGTLVGCRAEPGALKPQAFIPAVSTGRGSSEKSVSVLPARLSQCSGKVYEGDPLKQVKTECAFSPASCF